MESLGQLRREFTSLTAKLLQHVEAAGFALAYNEAKRSNEQAAINALGEPGRLAVADAVDKLGFTSLSAALRDNGKNNGVLKSVHQLGLAVDFDLYKGDTYLAMTDDHKPFGLWWEQQHPLARWGGHWGDGNHYSFEYQGVK